ncbi:MAG: serine acetyltransferase [Acidobacteria bacterium]|nr:serine acetyltransferase [Acidobacteriota bacterium]
MSELNSTYTEMAGVVGELVGFHRRFAGRAQSLPCACPLPSREAVTAIAGNLRSIIFPGYFGNTEAQGESLRYHLGASLDVTVRALEEQLTRGLCFGCAEPEELSGCGLRARELTRRFLERLPEIQRLMTEDVEAAYEGDPACTAPDEAILAYPGIYALTYHRVAHVLHGLGVPLLPRLISEIAHSDTGIDIHPAAQIGKRFFIDHGTGVVIGATCIIGQRVRVYQGVTLGAKSFPLDAERRPIKGIPRHPIVEDDVVIYSGATILGRITIGSGSVIGGNVWLTRSVPPGSRVSQGGVRYDGFESGSGI